MLTLLSPTLDADAPDCCCCALGSLWTEKYTLPSTQQELKVGRYYVTVKGSAELCGEYAINVRNESLTQFQASEGAASVF